MNRIIEEDVKFIFDILKNIVNLNELNNSNILITGGTGLFGKSILNFLIFIRRFHEFKITLLTRDKNSFLIKHPQYSLDFIDFIVGDIRNFYYDGESFDYIIHAAAVVSEKFERESPMEASSVIVQGSKNIIDTAKKMNVKKLLFISSGAVYGEQYQGVKSFSENYEGNPATYYGRAKKISENLFLQSSVDTSIARCFAFVGPYLNLNIHFAIGNFIRDALENQDITITGDGRTLRTYLYTADLVIWLFAILLNSKDKSVYNVGSSLEISIYDLAKKVASCVSGYGGKINILTKINYDIPPQRYIPNNEKIIRELGLRENFTLSESIKRTLRWNALNRSKI